MGLLQRGKYALVAGDALALGGDSGLYQTVGILVLGLFQAIQERFGTLDFLLDGLDRGALGIGDRFGHLAVLHRPGHPLALSQLREVVRLGDAQLLEGHGAVRDLIPGAAIGKDGQLLKQGFGCGLGRFFFLLVERRLDKVVGSFRRSSVRFLRFRGRFRLCFGLFFWCGLGFRLGLHRRGSSLGLRLGLRLRGLFRWGRRLLRRCGRLFRRELKGIDVTAAGVAAEDGVDIQIAAVLHLAKGPRAVDRFTHNALLLSKFEQKRP